MQLDERVDHVRAEPRSLGRGVDRRWELRVDGNAVGERHQIERNAQDAVVGADREHLGDARPGPVQRGDDRALPHHVVGGGR